MTFINRTSELEHLKSLWQQGRAQCVVLYGKRRVGKTELIKHFLNKNTGIYYLADRRTLSEQLLEFGRVVGNYFEDTILARRGFESWLEAFEYLRDKSKSKQFIVAIDEYPYLVETQTDTSSVFQKGWDEYLKDSNVFLILCGSSIAMMESELLAYRSPLYGRTTGRLCIESMSAESSRKFFPGKDFAEFMQFYAITGGMPAYLNAFARYDNVSKAVEELFFDKNGLYYNEVRFMLKQELRTPNIYFAILKAIAWGKTKVSEIANEVGEPVTLINKYLTTLEQLQFVKREVPVLEEKPHKSKSGIYVLSENMTRFWFQYVYAFSSDLEIGNLKQVKQRFKEYSNILEAIAYEEVARQHMRSMQKQLGQLDKVGRYWNRELEVDGIGVNVEDKTIVFMEAKWSKKKVGYSVLNELREKAARVDWKLKQRKEHFVLFGKSGFEDDLVREALENPYLTLVHQLDIIQ